MNDILTLAAAVIAALLCLLSALWLFGCATFDDGIGEPVMTAKPAPRRVRAGAPPPDMAAIDRAAQLAALHDFDANDGTKTPNPEIRHSPEAARWALFYTQAETNLAQSRADSMLPIP